MSREPTGSSRDFNRVAGVDANFRFFRNLSLNGFAARSETPGVTTNQDSAKASIGWEDSAKRLQASIMTIGEGFRDDLGFVRRTGVTRQFYDARSCPQPESLRRRGIRQLQAARAHVHLRDPVGRPGEPHRAHRQPDHVEQRRLYGIRVRAAPRRSRGRSRSFAVEHPDRPLRLDAAPAVLRKRSQQGAVGIHSCATVGDSGAARSATARSACSTGRRIRLVFDLGLQVSDISLQIPRRAEFTTTLVNLRSGYSFSSNMFLDTLLQYRTDVKQFSANVRFNLIHRPLSDFFIVYNESQFSDSTQAAGRGLVVKCTQMFAF